MLNKKLELLHGMGYVSRDNPRKYVNGGAS
jgi:hypothetical protein